MNSHYKYSHALPKAWRNVKNKTNLEIHCISHHAFYMIKEYYGHNEEILI